MKYCDFVMSRVVILRELALSRDVSPTNHGQWAAAMAADVIKQVITPRTSWEPSWIEMHPVQDPGVSCNSRPEECLKAVA